AAGPEPPVSVQLLRRLRSERGRRSPQRIERLRLHLLRRGGQAEAAAVCTGQLADELAAALLVLIGKLLRQRADLAERVGEVAVADRDEEARSHHALLQCLPLLL